MSRRSTAGMPVLVFSLVLAFMAGCFALAFASPLPAPQPNADPQIADCSKATDADIAKAVIENINKRFKPEEIKAGLHFSVTCKNGVVELSGRPRDKSQGSQRG